jgi:hypothetical protein
MAVTINASTTAGLVQTADTSGVLALQSAGTTAVSISASQVVTLTNALAEASGGTGTTVGYNGFKNRIINGAMAINQRAFNGTAVDGGFTLDRWQTYSGAAGKFTVSQSSTAPTGFKNSLLATSSSAYTPLGATESFTINQNIEGYNFSDFEFGTANAQPVTLSFRVYSSLTGTFGGSLVNSAFSRTCPFSYSIPTANTWTTVSVTIAGDTTGTWVTDNGLGLRVLFALGVGSSRVGTAGVWSSNIYLSATGATNLVSTNGATFYITGVQLEKGSTATSFDYRPYGTELMLCQRYYELLSDTGTGNGAFALSGYAGSGGTSTQQMMFKATKRATPSITINGTWGVSNCGQPSVYGYGTGTVTIAVVVSSTGQFSYGPNTGDDTVTASAEL